MHDIHIREDFPVYEKNPELIYLDSAASSLRAKPVIDAMRDYSSYSHANIHRGAYRLSYEATESYEAVRKKVANWIGSDDANQVIFTQGTTDSMNQIMRFCEADKRFEKGKKIILSIFEHHSNLVPWQYLAKKKEMILEYIYDFSEESLNKIDANTQIVAMTLMSNALGLIPPINKVIEKAHNVGAIVVGDAAQYIAHHRVDVQELDIDFLAFSGHKIFGPTGIGILYGKREWLDQVLPSRFGGDMIEYVTEQKTTFAGLPNRLEAGTPNIDGVVGLGSAIDFMINQEVHLSKCLDLLREYAMHQLEGFDFIRVIEPLKENVNISYGPIISFMVKEVHPHDVASILDQNQVAIRAGHHCAQPLMKYLNLSGTCRMSFSIYNTREDIDVCIDALKTVRRWLGYES